MTLISQAMHGSTESRVVSLQVLNMLADRYWLDLHSEAQLNIRQTLIRLLDEDSTLIQCWSFLALATIAAIPARFDDELDRHASSFKMSSLQTAKQQSEDTGWVKVWAHAVRKASTTPLSRAACHAAHTIFRTGKMSSVRCVQDIGNFLETVDIQGPPYPFDSVCTFLATALDAVRRDVRLYATDLDRKVLAWLEKWDASEGFKGKGRMDPHTPFDLLTLLRESCQLPPVSLSQAITLGLLPDCAIVNHILALAKSQPIRQFVLHGRIPDTADAEDILPVTSNLDTTSSSTVLDGGRRVGSQLLIRNLKTFCTDWLATDNHISTSPERVRRSIDFIVLTLAFQASLEIGGVRPDPSCTDLAIELLKLLKPSLSSTAYSVPGQNLIWQGFEPLIHTCDRIPETWPILLASDIQSGVRQDILPSSRYASRKIETSELSLWSDRLQNTIWAGPAVSLGMPFIRT